MPADVPPGGWVDLRKERAYDLVLFDLDGTLIGSHVQGVGNALVQVREYSEVVVIPGRLDALAGLMTAGVQVAIVTNQGGAAFRYQSTAEVAEKLRAAAGALGIRVPAGAAFPAITQERGSGAAYGQSGGIYAALSHPKAIVPGLRCGPHDTWRKPGPGMLLQAIRDRGVDPARTLMVGDMDTDHEAARAAGVAYHDVCDFFGSTETEEGL